MANKKKFFQGMVCKMGDRLMIKVPQISEADFAHKSLVTVELERSPTIEKVVKEIQNAPIPENERRKLINKVRGLD